ncbi:hypothetical protein SULI_02820 [Saccharolobus solfataricus]|uniref:Uncharacterized protein n=3 Tax=Saccharolobus solfataricus TaxID=2287 RepID=Q97V87_SACS2|nr:hypothetical protein [Saccharolobus solfataricus]AAK42858.1 Hypothetical protein SSO2748 [Saccharolobus solfataricus P2]AKA72949.1 hypothetical protein SULB_0552 [Saccharolobus solfataricus]AKA75648.1 hypothetical protein SULC_0550 [Saccharolobus solfataricus]AKA78341.1 hypothetical protein SULA_0550 [Saccharolobus solfataricus]AZF67460.1 hypothetical protein SULG_02820 [Saccharolobus solfataricus]
MPYAEEMEVKASRSQLLSFFIDPVRFAGILGHLMIVNIFDKAESKFVTMGSLKKPENKFKVLYLIGDPESRLITFSGIMEGPTLTFNTITYKGEGDNGKLTWRIDLILTELGKLTRMKVAADVKQSYGFLDRVRIGDFDFATHLVKEHVIPFVKFYFKPSILEETPVLNEVFRFRGSVEEVILKLREVIVNIKQGGIIILGDDYNIITSIVNGEVSHAQINNMDVPGSEVFAYLLKASGNVELIAYDISLDDLIFKNLKRRLEEVKAKS